MSDPLGTASYVLMTPDGDLANSRTLTADSSLGVTFNDFGPGGNVVFGTIGALEKINDLGSNGIVVGLASSPYFTTRSITSNDNSLTVTNGDGTAGNIDLSLGTGQSVQLINFEYNGAGEGTGTTLNLVPGSGVNISPSFDGSSKIMSYTLSSSTHGTVTSVGLTSTSGLTITGSPITSSGTFTVNIPTGTLHQYLRVASISPQVLEFATIPAVAPSDAYYLCQLGTDLPSPNGINLGASAAVIGIGTTTPGYTIDARNITARSANDYRTAIFSSQTAGAGSDVGGIDVRTYKAASQLNIFRAQGTIASPTAVANGEALSAINFGGYTGSAFAATAFFNVFATQDFTTSHQGTSLVVATTPNNSNVPVECFIIDQTGFIGIGTSGGFPITPVTTLDVYSANILSTPFSGACALNVVTDALAGSDIPGYSYFTNYGGTSANNAGSNIVLAGARGNKATPIRIFDGDVIAGLSVVGAHAVDNTTSATFSANPSAKILFVAGDDFTSASQPTAIQFAVTQIGSNTDFVRATLDSTGFLGIGTETPVSALEVHNNVPNPLNMNDFTVGSFVADTGGSGSTTNGGLKLDTYGGYTAVSLRSSEGALSNVSPLLSGNLVGIVNFAGQTTMGGSTAAYSNVASIRSTTTQDYTTSHLGSKLDIYTTPTNTNAQALVMTIDQSGFVGIGVTPPIRRLDVYNNAADATFTTDFTAARFVSDTPGSSDDFGGIEVDCYGGYSSLNLRTSGVSNAAISNGTIIGIIDFWGQTSSGYRRGTEIRSTATQDFTGSHNGSRLDFYTTVNSGTVSLNPPSGNVDPQLTIDQTGFVGVNLGADLPENYFHVFSDTANTSDFVFPIWAEADGATASNVGGGVLVTNYNGTSGTAGAVLALSSIRGNIGSLAHINNNDLLGTIQGRGAYNGTNFNNLASGSIIFQAAEAFTSSTNIGGRINFFTVPTASNTDTFRMTIDSTGYVGIGPSLTTPAYQLDVYTNNSTAAFHGVVESTIGSFTGPIFDSFVGTHTTGSYTLLRGARGTQASATHTVSGDVFGGVFAYGNGNTSTGIATFIGGAGVQFTALEDFNNGTTSAGTEVQILSVPTGSVIATTTMTLKQSSSTNSLVGIGTTSPLYNLDIYSASTATGVMIHTVGDNSALSNTGIIVDSYTGTHSGGGYLSMRSSRGTSGAVTPTLVNDIIGGINVYGNSVTGSGAAFGNSTAALNFNALETFAAGSNSGTNCTLTTTKIATNTPGISMYVAGGATTNAQVSIGMAPGSKMLELLSDSAQKPGVGGLWTVTPCDERVKTEIDHIDGGKALAKIKAMIPRTYKFTPEYVAHRENLLNANAEEGAERIPSDVSADDIQHGFVAQELAAVFPEAVVDSTTQVGTVENLKGVNLGLPLIMLFKAFQELTTKVEALEAQLAAK